MDPAPSLHPGARRDAVEADPDVGSQRRIWVPESAPCAKDRGDPRRSRLLPGAYLPGVRQPGAHRDIASRQAKNMCDEGRGVGPRSKSVTRRPARPGCAAAASTSTSPTRSTGQEGRLRRVRGTSSTCTPRSPARTRTTCRCASTRPCTHRDQVGSGRLRPHVQHPRPVRGGSRPDFLRPRCEPAGGDPRSCRVQRRLPGPLEHDVRLPGRRVEKHGTIDDSHPAVQEALASTKERINKLLAVKGNRTVDSFHRARADHVGVLRHGAARGRRVRGRAHP